MTKMAPCQMFFYLQRTRFAVLLSACLCLWIPAPAQSSLSQSVTKMPAADTSAPKAEVSNPFASIVAGDDYVVTVDDVLDMYAVDITELSRTFRVSPNGTLTLPLVGKPLPAAGLTLQQLSDSIADALRENGVVLNAQITISVQQSRMHSVAVSGAVKHPQIYSVFGRTTLLDVISQAEGLADDAGNIAIIRRGDTAARALHLNPQDDAALTLRVDLKQVMETGDVDSNLDVYPGDRVTIPRAGIVYVVGAVNKPGGFTIRPNRQGMTVLQAVALAEDVKSTAKREQAVIVRVDSQSTDGHKQIPVDLKKVLAGKSPDPVLQAEDILFVPDSLGKKAMRRGLESALQAVTGIVIYSRY